MAQTITITLAGEEIECYELPVNKLQSWRKLARPIIDIQDEVVDTMREGSESNDTEQIKCANRMFEGMIDEYLSLMLDLVLEWIPDQSRRDRYASGATTAEVLGAFFPLARLAYRSSVDFFMAMLQDVLIAGSPSNQTGTNSPDPSGASGTANLTPTEETNSLSLGSLESDTKPD